MLDVYHAEAGRHSGVAQTMQGHDSPRASTTICGSGVNVRVFLGSPGVPDFVGARPLPLHGSVTAVISPWRWLTMGIVTTQKGTIDK